MKYSEINFLENFKLLRTLQCMCIRSCIDVVLVFAVFEIMMENQNIYFPWWLYIENVFLG